MKLIIATGNMDKKREISEILEDFEIVTMKEASVDIDIVEDGTTFEENALIKAKAVWDKIGGLVLADDSGLEIDALNKEPGIYSARYMGENTSYHEKNMSFINRLEGVAKEDRTARFICAIAAVFPDGTSKTVRGVMEGYIGYEEQGENGFGYDPIFIMPKYGVSNSCLEPAVKNLESHRGKALRAMKDILIEKGLA